MSKYISPFIILGILGILTPKETLASSEDDIYKHCDTAGGICHGMKNGVDPECFRAKKCDAVVAVYLEPNEHIDRINRSIIVDIYGTAGVGEDKYIALGISKDRLVGEDMIYACAHQSGTTPEVLTAWNNERSITQIPTAPLVLPLDSNPDLNVKILTNKFTDGKLSCSFKIPKGIGTIFEKHGTSYYAHYNLNSKRAKYFLLIAEGPYDNGQMAIHSNKLSTLGPVLTATTLDWSSHNSCSTYHVGLNFYAVGVIIVALI